MRAFGVRVWCATYVMCVYVVVVCIMRVMSCVCEIGAAWEAKFTASRTHNVLSVPFIWQHFSLAPFEPVAWAQ